MSDTTMIFDLTVVAAVAPMSMTTSPIRGASQITTDSKSGTMGNWLPDPEIRMWGEELDENNVLMVANIFTSIGARGARLMMRTSVRLGECQAAISEEELEDLPEQMVDLHTWLASEDVD